jgi:hypothetical protein
MSQDHVPIKVQDLDRLTVDGKNRIYWDGKLALSPAQTRLAVAVAIAAMLGSIGTVANATVSWLTYLKRQNAPVIQAVPVPQSAPFVSGQPPEKQVPTKPN